MAACVSGMSAFHAVGGVDHIRAGLLVEDDEHGGLAVGEAEIAHILHARRDTSAISSESHRRAVAIGNDKRLILVGGRGGVVHIKLIMLTALVDRRPWGCSHWRRKVRRARLRGRCRI